MSLCALLHGHACIITFLLYIIVCIANTNYMEFLCKYSHNILIIAVMCLFSYHVTCLLSGLEALSTRLEIIIVFQNPFIMLAVLGIRICEHIK